MNIIVPHVRAGGTTGRACGRKPVVVGGDGSLCGFTLQA
jgi:hypothetical protein